MSDKEVFLAAHRDNREFYHALLSCIAISHNLPALKIAKRIVDSRQLYSPAFKDYCKGYLRRVEETETIEF